MPHRRANDIQPGVFHAGGWLFAAFALGVVIDTALAYAVIRWIV